MSLGIAMRQKLVIPFIETALGIRVGNGEYALWNSVVGVDKDSVPAGWNLLLGCWKLTDDCALFKTHTFSAFLFSCRKWEIRLLVWNESCCWAGLSLKLLIPLVKLGAAGILDSSLWFAFSKSKLLSNIIHSMFKIYAVIDFFQLSRVKLMYKWICWSVYFPDRITCRVRVIGAVVIINIHNCRIVIRFRIQRIGRVFRIMAFLILKFIKPSVFSQHFQSSTPMHC